MKINIEKSQIWTPCGSPLPSISLLLEKKHFIIGKETLFVHDSFSI